MSIGVEDTFVRNFAVFLQERVLCFEKKVKACSVTVFSLIFEKVHFIYFFRKLCFN